MVKTRSQAMLPKEQHSPLEDLPTEIHLHILSFLDLTSLCRVACVNRKLKTLAYDKSLYTKLDLFDFKSDPDPELLEKFWQASPLVQAALAKRCQRLCKLDVFYFDAKLKAFLVAADCRITHLQTFANIELPDWSELVDVALLRPIVACKHFTPLLRCHRLVRLNLMKSNMSMKQIVMILRQNLLLKYLSIQHSFKLQNLEHLTRSLPNYNGLLETVKFDIGKISCEMIDNIAELRHLRELELVDELDNETKYGDNLLNLFISCKLLRKLSLLGFSQVTAREINGLVERCPGITHLVLDGCPNTGIDYDLGRHILSSLHSMENLSMGSTCMSPKEFLTLRRSYPKVRLRDPYFC